MKREFVAAAILALSTMYLGGCKKAEPPSPIVQKVEAAGSGDLSQSSTKSISDWFNKHQALAKEVKNDCLAVRDSKPATWRDSTEGRVCTAAVSSTMMGNEPMKTDDKKY